MDLYSVWKQIHVFTFRLLSFVKLHSDYKYLF